MNAAMCRAEYNKIAECSLCMHRMTYRATIFPCELRRISLASRAKERGGA